MLRKVTHCAGHVSVNTRPQQLRWGDWEMGTAMYMYMWQFQKSVPEQITKFTKCIVPIASTKGQAHRCFINPSFEAGMNPKTW